MNKYLGNEICAFSGNWLVVYDGKYNYMLFDISDKRITRQYERGRMPHNGGTKQVEYYSTFDNAVNNLVKVARMGRF